MTTIDTATENFQSLTAHLEDYDAAIERGDLAQAVESLTAIATCDSWDFEELLAAFIEGGDAASAEVRAAALKEVEPVLASLDAATARLYGDTFEEIVLGWAAWNA